MDGFIMATFNEDIVGGRGMGFGGGDGFGGMAMGLLLGLLVGNRGIFGNQEGGRDCRDCVTNESLNQQTLGDIKASVPLAEAQVQLALAGLQASLASQATQDTQYLSNQTQQLALAQMQLAAGLSREITAVDTNVDRQATALQAAINADGEKTRSLITNNQIAELNQRLTVAQLEGQELRGERNRDRDRQEIQIQMIQNQNQQQQQQQAIQYRLAEMANLFGQVARATQGNVIVGSTGTVASNTANPTNVAA